MYNEIIKELMKAKMTSMIIAVVLLVVAFVLIYVFSVRPAKKKMSKKKRRWYDQHHDKSWAWFVAVTLIFAISFGVNLYYYLSLRQDLINENYATYTGEFYYHYSPKDPDYVEWTDDQGKTQRARYLYRIEKFQDGEHRLREDYYKGTIVYAPNGGHLLWWDAEPIGD